MTAYVQGDRKGGATITIVGSDNKVIDVFEVNRLVMAELKSTGGYQHGRTEKSLSTITG